MTSNANLGELSKDGGEAIKLVWLGQIRTQSDWELLLLSEFSLTDGSAVLKMDWVSCGWCLVTRHSGVRSHHCGHVYTIFT